MDSVRTKIDYGIPGVKRIRIVKYEIRTKGGAIRDQIMLNVCGLHNLRINCRNLWQNPLLFLSFSKYLLIYLYLNHYIKLLMIVELIKKNIVISRF
jgi:hypothetical protein